MPSPLPHQHLAALDLLAALHFPPHHDTNNLFSEAKFIDPTLMFPFPLELSLHYTSVSNTRAQLQRAAVQNQTQNNLPASALFPP